MSLSLEQLRLLYQKRAKRYDFTANFYYVLGFREQAYRRAAVRALSLQPGATVVEIGCGTGLNFSLIEKEIGPDGRLVGVDLTPEMLARARQRVAQAGWKNVELIQSRAADYQFTTNIQGIISSFALTLEPEYDAVIQRGAAALAPAGRFVVLDFKLPERWPRWLVQLFLWITRPFGVTLDLAERHPWESIARHLDDYQIKTLYWGLAYIASGSR